MVIMSALFLSCISKPIAIINGGAIKDNMIKDTINTVHMVRFPFCFILHPLEILCYSPQQHKHPSPSQAGCNDNGEDGR